ncbi:MAG: 2Fe-2S iron-sulfur cluster-binding protein [Saprospiraceae bacterium]|nr:2Fe-2S iron-sulfur cluster-binding protein [Saprospiraceae bacterium]
MSAKFYPLKVKDVREETSSCVSVAFELNGIDPSIFDFDAGQYITLKKSIDGEEVRRSYSLCSSPGEKEIRVAIKKVIGGKFSTYANEELEPGTVINVMPPQGNFKRKESAKAESYVAFAAGSGITPVISLIKDILGNDPNAEIILVYGNKSTDQIIFKEQLESLKNKYLDRLQIIYVLSQEVQESPLFTGRIDKKKVSAFAKYFFKPEEIDQYFVCGPEPMIWSVKEQLEEIGIDEEKISFELFNSTITAEKHASYTGSLKEEEAENVSEVTVILDGRQFQFPLGYKGNSILDAALKTGADLPFACKGGVCSTCKAKLLEGDVEMEVNYALEPDEVESGFILTCQSHPRTPSVKVDYDVS